MKPSISKSTRGSKYRGVSKNGKKWQVQLLGNLRKRYIGSISSEQAAAKLYDYYAILTHGLNAKTNFSYTKAQVQNFVLKFNEDDILAPSHLKMKTGDSSEELTNSNKDENSGNEIQDHD